MQTNRTFHTRRIFSALGTLAALALAGCVSPTVTNMTPTALPVNPSQTYTITASVKPSASNVIPGSESVKIIIGGQAYKMTKSPNIDDVYEFDYKAPDGVTEIAYYFLDEYNVVDAGIVSARTDYSPLQHATIVDRGATGGLSANRGPAGARVAIAGRGFTVNDSVFFDDTPVRPTLESQNSLSFFVPPLEANRSYTISVGDAPGKINVGTFRIDPSSYNAPAPAPTTAYTMATNADVNANPPVAYASYPTPNATTTYTASGASGAAGSFGSGPSATTNVVTAPAPTGNNISINRPTNDITVSPDDVTVRQGDYIVLKFITPRIVTGQPLLIDVTTDIPKSVIMPEVYVKVGSNVGSVNLKGGQPGRGHLFVKAAGYPNTLTIPITVK